MKFMSDFVGLIGRYINYFVCMMMILILRKENVIVLVVKEIWSFKFFKYVYRIVEGYVFEI